MGTAIIKRLYYIRPLIYQKPRYIEFKIIQVFSTMFPRCPTDTCRCFQWQLRPDPIQTDIPEHYRYSAEWFAILVICFVC